MASQNEGSRLHLPGGDATWELLQQEKVQILEDQRQALSRALIPNRFYGVLGSLGILSQSDREEIEAERTSSAKANMFLDILKSKGPDGYDGLVKAMDYDGTQTYHLKNLNLAFEQAVTRVSKAQQPEEDDFPEIGDSDV